MPLLSRLVKTGAGLLIWRSERNAVQTLLRFARTEAGGAVDIARAAQATACAELKHHLARHAEDEARHATLFRGRARDIAAAAPSQTMRPAASSADLLPAAAAGDRSTLSLTDHGFLPSDNFTALGELRYVAMLHLAELQAAEDFRVHFRLTARRDPDTAAVFRQILRDEEYHCAWTRAQLDKWRRDGRDGELRKALRQLRSTRRKAAWLQIAQVTGDGIGRVVSTVVYLTAFVPFGIIGRLTGDRVGWRAAPRRAAAMLAGLRLPA